MDSYEDGEACDLRLLIGAVSFCGFLKETAWVMIRGLGFGESQALHFLLGLLLSLFLCVLGMRNNDGPKPHSGRTNGFIPTSFRTISGYLRIVSSGASTVASTVRSAASSIVDRDDDASHDQVLRFPTFKTVKYVTIFFFRV